jgi:hypothetical protein
MAGASNPQPLPLPRFDAVAVAEFARRGYAWTPLSCEGLNLRWLTAPRWTQVLHLTPKGPDGFVPFAGFVHEPSHAAVGIRYSKAAFDFDVADFLEVADPRPAVQSGQYVLEGSEVAERAGWTEDGDLFTCAVHRRGPHVLVVTAEWPAAIATELQVAVTAFSAGLAIEAPPHAPIERGATFASDSLPVAFDYPARGTVTESSGAVVRIGYGEHHAATLRVRIAAAGTSTERALALSAIELHKRLGKPVRGGLPICVSATAPQAAPPALRTSKLGNGSEVTLAAVSLASGHLIAIEAVCPGAGQQPNGWLNARFATRRLIQSCRPR